MLQSIHHDLATQFGEANLYSGLKDAVFCPAAIHPPCAKLAPACGFLQAGSFTP